METLYIQFLNSLTNISYERYEKITTDLLNLLDTLPRKINLEIINGKVFNPDGKNEDLDDTYYNNAIKVLLDKDGLPVSFGVNLTVK